MFEKLLGKAENKLKAAKHLFAGGFYDDAVSRAYYAIFYAARALLSLKKIYPKTHKSVISQFGLEFVKSGFVEKIYGKIISYAKDRREEADYGITTEIMKEEAEDILKSAEKFIQNVKTAREVMDKTTKETDSGHRN